MSTLTRSSKRRFNIPMLYPMYALVCLTLITGLITVRARFRAVLSKDLSIKYFRAMQGTENMPEYAAIPARHFVNLFEIPVLFYAVCILSMIMQLSGPLMIGLAWAFVGCRVLQAIVHMGYNNVRHRMAVFILGFMIVFAMWTLLVIWSI